MDARFWRRHATTAVLAVLAVLAVVFYVVLDHGRVTSREASRREGQLLPAWRKADVQRIAVRLPGRPSLLLERDAADAGELDYRMLEPVADAEIDVVALDHLLTALEFAPVLRKLDAAPEQFGVVLAQIEVSMGKVQIAFELGGEAAFPAGAHYLRLTRADAARRDVLGYYVVPGELVADLTTSPHDYRSKQIVPYLSIALDALDVQTTGPMLRLERTNPVSFHILGTGLRASRKRMDGIWAAFAETRIESFAESPVEEAAQLAAVATPRVLVTMRPDEGPVAVLAYGGECPGHPERIVVLRTAPSRLLGCVPREAQDGLLIGAEALTDRGLFALFEDELAELSAERGALRFDVARESNGFRRRSPDSKLLDKDEQASLDTALGFLFVENAVLTQAKPTFVASASLRVVGGRGAPGGGELVEEVELGQCDGVAACARRKGDGALLLLPAAAYLRLMPTLDWMRSTNLGLPSERAARIDLDCGTHQTLVQESVGYRFEVPAGLDVDAGRALELADYLRRFRASGFVDDSVDRSAAFASSACRIGIGDTKLELAWDGAQGFLLGRVQGARGLWLADDELRTWATRIYLRRTFWNDPAPIDELTIHAGAAHTMLRADAGLDPRFLRLASLRAQDVVHLGAPRAAEEFASPQATFVARHGDTVRRASFGASGFLRFSGVDATFAVSPDELAELLRAPVESSAESPPDAGAR